MLEIGQQKSDNRRGFARNIGGRWVADLEDLANRIHRIGSGSTMSTTAVATFIDDYDRSFILVSGQGYNPNLQNQRVLDLLNTDEYTLIAINDRVHAEGYLHAEMMIIRYLVSRKGFTKDSLAGKLQIGVTKGACDDCSGWLGRYRVPHNSSGVPSNYWKHPTSGSAFQGYDEVDTYTKNGVSYTGANLWAYE